MSGFRSLGELTDANPCPRCGAVSGERCFTRSGKVATLPHAARWDLIGDAYAAGYEEGEHYALASSDLERTIGWHKRTCSVCKEADQ